MASEKESVTFNSSIRRIFDSWMALKLAVEHSFGGADSQAIAKWMVDAVEQWFRENSNIEPYEVEEVLGSMLTNELNTVADDGSLPQISKHICTCYNLLKLGSVSEVESLLSKLPQAQVNQCVQGQEESSDDSEDEMDEASTSQVASNHYSNPTNEEDNTTEVEMEEDDGWTKVSRKGKKR